MVDIDFVVDQIAVPVGTLAAHQLVGTVTQAYDETAPVGQVLAASQEPGTELTPNNSIDLTVSKGREPIPIVSYVGKTRDEAVQGLEGAGLTVSVTEEHSSSVEAGSVISQDPIEGTRYRGDQVALVVSLGPLMVEIPNVQDLWLIDAQSLLSAEGFRPDNRNVNTSGMTIGRAAGTEPAAGTLAPEGSVVTILVV